MQRWQKEKVPTDKRCGPKTTPANKLTNKERMNILAIANSKEYCNQPPSQIVPNLADQGIYIASESTFYRVLKQAKQAKHRGTSAPRTHTKPGELVALKPNQVWSWDISYLPREILGQFFYLYMFEDIYSRKIVGAHVYEKESAEYAAMVISKAYLAEDLHAGEVTLHSDNGSPMKGSTMLATLQRLGIMPSFSRPSVSDDNPFSEALFRTVKYCPFYPSKPFSSLTEAQDWVLNFVDWYNNAHKHSGINFVTPNSRHQEVDGVILSKRAQLYATAQQKNPNRWSRNIRNWQAAGPVYLNPKHSQAKVA